MNLNYSSGNCDCKFSPKVQEVKNDIYSELIVYVPNVKFRLPSIEEEFKNKTCLRCSEIFFVKDPANPTDFLTKTQQVLDGFEC